MAQVDEGAGLFVRGGDVSETAVLLDESPLNHPYRYETPTGGFRGAVDPFLTQGVSFSTGGFSAEYGNSLSGVVDMRGLDRPTVRRVNATAGLAGVSVPSASRSARTAGVRVSRSIARRPSVLFAVNPSPREFDQLPGGWDASASAYFEQRDPRLAHGVRARAADHVGVELEQDAFAGFLHSGARHHLVLVASWQRPLASGWNVSGGRPVDTYVDSTDVGVLQISADDDSAGVLASMSADRSGTGIVRFGADAGWARTDAQGHVPERGGDFGGVERHDGLRRRASRLLAAARTAKSRARSAA